ncbi:MULTISPECIES: oligosaccharide flippase family protein [unclassified Enterococcus]|uniref:oligosaccharide flippase family protein n=1 Tax=unclassified Enterococcus TaxID=2608891 RepID=UPI001CE20EE5|nr:MULTISPECIES: oligosaccharide flippase family protein [unclassified Enterococcus]MCA5014440.1 oligosaccharide flippase family protein [Enterococcus sp. S23]MCA5017446.1 oligosaccharide flippase family protein [Enterococcus sp. S22(2020)]
MNKKVVSNFFYQGSYQLLTLLLPMITIPIVSHALGAQGIGLYQYIGSIVYYFVLVAGLGIANYGIREIASVRDDRKKLSERFWELELFNAFIALIMIMLYLVCISFLPNKLFFLISGISLLATLFDITWFYSGIEDFKAITSASFLVKIVSFLAIVILIKDQNDLVKYFIIQSSSVLLTNVVLWLFIFKRVDFTKVSLKHSMKHFFPALHYFLGKIAITLYTTLNKTLLGMLASTAAVGLYFNSLQLTTIFVALIGTLDTVLLPYMTNLYTHDGKEKMVHLMKRTLHLQLYFSIPLMFGIIATNQKLIPWFFGDSFQYIRYTVPVLAPLVVVMPLGVSIVRQYLIPMNHIHKFNVSVIGSAIVSVMINVILIPVVGIWGAVLATLIAELLVTVIRVVDLIRTSDFSFDMKKISIYLVGGLLMWLTIYIVTADMTPTLTTTLLQVVIGVIVYLSFTTILSVNPIFELLSIKKK